MKKVLPFLLLLVGYNALAQTFEKINSELPDIHFSFSALGDVDNDGDLDLYVSGLNANDELESGLYIYDTDSNSYTLSTTAYLPALSTGAAQWGDIDNDGDQDLVLTAYDDVGSSAQASIYLNNLDGTFTLLATDLAPTYLGDLALVDINNDNFLDIAITGLETAGWSFITKIYKNNGGTSFSELPLTLPGMNFGNIKFADYNSDGYSDFALKGMNVDSYFTKIYTNNGDETFTESGIALDESWIGDMAWGDYNGDGHIDLAVSGTGGESGTERKTMIYKNNGDNTFTDIEAGLIGVSHSGLEWADFDNDGDLDLLVIGAADTPGDGEYANFIYNNDGNDTFTKSTSTNLKTCYYGDVESGDINGDGKTDLIITGYDDFDVSFAFAYLNTTLVANNNVEVEQAFEIYPNPTINHRIEINTELVEGNVSIVDISGAVVYHGQLADSYTIEIPELSSGVYFVRIVANHQTFAQKLVIL